MQGVTRGRAGEQSAASQYGTYEFNEAENDVIGRCGSRTLTWGIIQIVVAGVVALVGLPGLIYSFGATLAGSPAALAFALIYLLEFALILFLGVTWTKAGSALRRVVSTQGNDISLLMDALSRVGTAFLTLTILMVVGVALALIGVVLLYTLVHST